MYKASINLVTVREGGLDWQLKLLAQQTCSDFEIVIVDGLYTLRKEAIASLANALHLNVKHLPLPQLSYVTELTHSTNRNEALAHSEGDIIIFFDDYQQPAPNFVATHIKYCKPKTMVATRQVCYYHRNTVDYSIWADQPDWGAESFEHDEYRNPQKKQVIFNMDPRSLWTNGASVHRADLQEVVGFDERYNGGTGGEDGDLGMRLSHTGCVLFFTTETWINHISHHHIPMMRVTESLPLAIDLSRCNHDRQPFTVNQYHTGDYNLTTHATLYTHRDMDGIKYYICENCGGLGVIDSIEVINFTTQTRAFKGKVFPTTVDGRKTFAKFPIKREILERLTNLYAGTGYTYYADALKE